MINVFEANKIISKHIPQLKIEEVSVLDSLGRVLAEDVVSNRNHPPYDISAMDGYAFMAGPSGNDSEFKITAEIKAGFTEAVTVGIGECAMIMTGAPIPKGVDTVVRVEDILRDGDTTKLLKEIKVGSDIRRLGENIKFGEVVLTKGTDLNPAAVSTLAMVKKKIVKVYKRPTVAVLSTGDELEGLDEPFDDKNVPDANSYAIMGQLKSIGITPTLLGIARDNVKDLEAKLKEGLLYDVLIVSGGVSVGEFDFVKPTLETLGITMHFWKVSMKPGKPVAFGTHDKGQGNGLVFGLPGNPVSSMVCFEELVVPALRDSMGYVNKYYRTVKAKLNEDFKNKGDRTNFVRVNLLSDGSELSVQPFGKQGSGILMSMVGIDGFMVLPADCDGLKSGADVTVQLIGGGFQKELGYKI